MTRAAYARDHRRKRDTAAFDWESPDLDWSIAAIGYAKGWRKTPPPPAPSTSAYVEVVVRRSADGTPVGGETVEHKGAAASAAIVRGTRSHERPRAKQAGVIPRARISVQPKTRSRARRPRVSRAPPAGADDSDPAHPPRRAAA